MQIENCGVPLIGTNCQKSALEQRVASLTRELEEAKEALGAKEEKRAMWDRLAHQHQADGQAFYEELEALKRDVLAAINGMEEGWRGTKMHELGVRLSREASD